MMRVGAVQFAWPWLLLLPLPWLLWRVCRSRAATDRPALRLPGAEGFFAALAAAGQGRRRFPWLWGGVWVMLCVAAARPQTLEDVPPVARAGRELMLAVDISGSMEEQDMVYVGTAVTRLTAVQAVLDDFIARRRGDHLGLVVFGSQAFVVTPLTFDHTSLRQQVQQLSVGMAGDMTAIGDAIALAVKRLRERPGDTRVLVLLTDGDNTAGELAPAQAAELAATEGVRIHTVYFGGDGRIQLGQWGFSLPGFGDSARHQDALRAIAEHTGGEAYRASDAAELADIYARIDRLEAVQQPGQAARLPNEHYPLPLALAALLAVLALGLPWPLRRLPA